jgi:hypothetical protein
VSRKFTGINPHNETARELTRAKQEKIRKWRRREPAKVLLKPAEYVAETKLIHKEEQ